MTADVGLQGLRVALVGPLPPPAGGMANQTFQLSELLRRAGAGVELIQTNAPYQPAWVGRIQGVRALARLLPYLWRLWAAAGRNQVMHLMANSGWSWHLFAAPALWIARLRRVPVVVNYRGGEAGPFLARSAGAVRMSLQGRSQLVVPSGFLQEVFARHGMTADVVPNIVDLLRFHPGARADGTERILVARNLEPIYDNATALRAFAKVLVKRPKASLLLAGTGPEEAALRQLAIELGVAECVEFAGRLDRDVMATRLRESAVALNPSLVDNMPNSVLEALASGVPVVSTRVGGVPFIVQHGVTAQLVPAGDADAMAEAILKVLNDGALAQAMAQAGLLEAQRYTWAKVAPLLEAAYRALLGPRAVHTAA